MFQTPKLWLWIAVLSCHLIHRVASRTQPHVIMIMIDDQGYNERSSRNPEFRTPVMDRLESQSVRLTRMYMQPSCSMSRAAWMTGRYPHTMGIEQPFQGYDNRSIPVDIKLLPQYLKDAGYQTYMIGKWHSGMCSWSMAPTRRGFDAFSGCLFGNGDHFFQFKGNPYDFWTNETLDRSVSGQYDTEVLTQRTIDVIKEHRTSRTTQPFFINLAYKAIHVPITVPEYYSKRCSHINDTLLRDRCGTMAGVDDGIKNITDTLEQLGYMDKPLLLMVTSDNGGDSPYGASNWPLRGKKSTVFEGGTLVPAFMYSRVLFPDAPRDYNGLLHVTDLPVTIINLANNSTTPVVIPNVDGKNQWLAIKQNGSSKRDKMVYQMWLDVGAVRVGQFKLVYHKRGPCSGWQNPLSAFNTTLPENVTIAKGICCST
ncbi:arylsulfatase I-like [Pomacea canaliculata]|uniref:arylsulfatase I-like n=1 Tax=Pomacea canaliculata TaxID=400727 RepID=UPI000D72C986|nr:arylsulfatase I-like [Pomacea canaliculata]